MADIIAELQTIKNGIYGKDIRMAIHDALQKVNEDGGGGGGGGSLSVNVAHLAAYGTIEGTIDNATVPNGGEE